MPKVGVYQPSPGEHLLRLGVSRSASTDSVEEVIYVKLYDEFGFQVCHRIEQNHPPGVWSYPPVEGHLFTLQGIDIHSGKKSENQLVVELVEGKNGL